MRLVPSGLVLLLALNRVGPAFADGPSREQLIAAETAFDEGKRLLKQGRTEPACGKFEESQRLAPASGTLLNLGDCYERLGRTATAWGTFRAAAAAARSKGNAKREDEAGARALALEPRLSKLRIVVPDEARVSGLEIKSGDVSIGDSMWGVPMPVDPGQRTITATAPARAGWSKDVTVPATPGVTDVTLPTLEAAPSTERPSTPPVATSPPATGLGTQRVAGLVVGGIGVVALAVGIGFGADAIGKKDRSNAEGGCKNNLCPQKGLDLRDQAVTEGYVSTALFIGAGVALAGGAVLWLSAPREGTTVSLGVTHQRALVQVGAAF